uniref:Uncharacterized protein n=1 Tax=Rhizophora mucronata TaxID=61149 RepID=A0A2P2PRR5_RHIMU
MNYPIYGASQDISIKKPYLHDINIECYFGSYVIKHMIVISKNFQIWFEQNSLALISFFLEPKRDRYVS